MTISPELLIIAIISLYTYYYHYLNSFKAFVTIRFKVWAKKTKNLTWSISAASLFI